MKKTILFLLIAITCACNRDIPVNKNVLSIVVDDSLVKSLNFSDIVEEYKIIPLETTSDNLIGYIYKIVEHDNKLFILDEKMQTKVLVFGFDGKYLYSIGEVGNAANEYIAIGGFTIDKQNNRVLIIDENKEKVIVYSIEGEYLDSKKLEFTPRDIHAYNTGIAFVGGGQNKQRLHLTDFDFKNIKSFFPSNVKNTMMMINPFATTGDTLLYRSYLCDTIYSVCDNELSATRIIDYKTNALTWDRIKNMNQYEQANIENHVNDYYCDAKYYSETSDFIWFLYSKKMQPCVILYDKQNKKKIEYLFTDTYNDIIFDKYCPLIVGANDTYFIGQSDPYSILENFPQQIDENWDSMTKQRYQTIKPIVGSLGEDSNPILTLVKFKNL